MKNLDTVNMNVSWLGDGTYSVQLAPGNKNDQDWVLKIN